MAAAAAPVDDSVYFLEADVAGRRGRLDSFARGVLPERHRNFPAYSRSPCAWHAIRHSARVAAWIAAIVFAANPNLIYMQSTAMGEALYLALFVWAIVYFAEAQRGDQRALFKCGLCLFGACLTRYDGWFLAVAIVVLQMLSLTFTSIRPTKVALAKFILLAGAGPALWLAYNGIVYRNPLEFENGPYSAKAIEQRTQSSGTPGHPGSGNPALAGMYFLKSAEANVAHKEWLHRSWLLLAFAGLVIGAVTIQRGGIVTPAKSAPRWPLLLLLVPIPFYALSVAYGGVPIFIPYWWPFTHYNVRYGLQLLPAFAVAFAMVIHWAMRAEVRIRIASVIGVLLFVAASYASIWQATPICLEEASVNMRTRQEFERQLAMWLEKLPPDATLLMYLGDHVGAVERAGVPLNHTINEGNHRVWRQPVDTDGLWERALANPTQYADYVLAFEGDPVWSAVSNSNLRELVEIHVTGQSRGILYRAR